MYRGADKSLAQPWKEIRQYMYRGADKSLAQPWKETSYSDQDLQHSTKTYAVQTTAIYSYCLYAISLGTVL